MFKIRLGDQVVYNLNAEDVEAINRHRRESDDRLGNPVHVGQRTLAHIVRIFDGAEDYANLQCLLDGNDSHWVTSVHHGDGNGEFHYQHEAH